MSNYTSPIPYECNNAALIKDGNSKLTYLTTRRACQSMHTTNHITRELFLFYKYEYTKVVLLTIYIFNNPLHSTLDSKREKPIER